MLALVYLGLAICVGERISGYFFRFISIAHRWATGAVVGILLSACYTYLVGRHFASSSKPLLLADIIFFATTTIFLIKCPRRQEILPIETRVSRSATSDWITLGFYTVLVCWMMFATLNFREGRVEIGLNQWSDYGPNTAIVQNFAYGHNFPAEYPHYANEPIRYHFLFYFVAGNLEFLGLNLAWAENLVSIVTFLSLLALVMAFGELLFKSRAVGILASAFFFFHGTFNLVPFLQKETGGKLTWEAIKKAASAIYHLGAYLSSGYPYRGEDWGIWTQVVYINQRHLASSIGVFLVVLIFLFDRYIDKGKERQLARAAAKRARMAAREPTHGVSSALDVPTQYDYGQRVTDPSVGSVASTSELESVGHAGPVTPASETTQAEHLPQSEPLRESSYEVNSAATAEGHLSEAPPPNEQSHRIDEARSPEQSSNIPVHDERASVSPTTANGEAERSSPAIPESFKAANYPATNEGRVSDTVGETAPRAPLAEGSSAAQTEPSPETTPVEHSPWIAKHIAPANEQVAEPLAKQESLPPITESAVPEVESVPRTESFEESNRLAPETSETPATFATRAYDEYMGLKSEPALAHKAEEVPAAEPVHESLQAPVIEAPGESASEPQSDETPVPEPVPTRSRGFIDGIVYDQLVNGKSFIFCGLLLGCLPYWNAPVFTAAAAMLAFLFVLFPYRRYMVSLAITAGLIAIPQILALRAGNTRAGASLIHWGYTLGAVPVTQVLKYLWWTFGLKWILILVALLFFSWRNIRLFVAMFSLFLITFCLQFSDENLANHKFLNIWLVLANLFVGYGVWRLWRLGWGFWTRLPFRIVAIALVFPIVLGGAIDFFPIHNLSYIETNYTKDRLIDWIRAETDPRAVFLTDKFVNHPILLAGRKIFFGYTYFTWGAGYDLSKREPAYKLMFESKNAHQVFTLLKANKIDYVAWDAGVRGVFKNSNEQEVYVPNFKKVFEGSDYWQLVIYKVPENADYVPQTSISGGKAGPVLGINAFDGGKGKENGQFDFPRGLTVDNAGNILIADSNNNRLQKFSPTGAFISLIGTPGTGPGQFQQPGGVAVDSNGNIYVADVSNHRVQKLKPDGTFIAEWKGPEGGFYGPRDIAVGPDNSIYVVDEGHGRIVKFDADGKTLAIWGVIGKEDGQFGDATSVAIDGKNNKVYIADPGNRRIQVFDTYGKFLAKWTVDEWLPTGWSFQDLVVDPQTDRLYASSVATDDVIAFDLSGNKIANLKPTPPDKLEGASSLAIAKGKLYALNTYGNRLSVIDISK